MKANKQQKEYLKEKIRSSIHAAKRDFAAGKDTGPSEADKAALLKKAGFVSDAYGEYRYARYLELPKTALHKKNEAAIEAYNGKLDTMLAEAYDNIELGDDADALEFLKNFVADLKKVK